MFENIKNHKRNKEMGIETPIKLWSSPLVIALALAVPVMTAYLAIGYLSSSLLLTLGMTGATIAGAIRAARTIDSDIVGRHVAGKSNKFTEFFYERLKNTPLRFYTVNQMAQKFENIKTNRENKEFNEAKKRAKKLNSEKAEMVYGQSEKDLRTYNYIKKVAEPRRHLNYVMAVAIGVFTGVRVLTGSSSNASLNPLQMVTRFSGYAFGMTLAAAHIHAYIIKRASEQEARPFFIMTANMLDKIPTKHLANWIIKRDLENIRDLEQGKQVWRWRVSKNIIERVPYAPLKNWLIKKLDERQLEITPAVQKRLDVLEIKQRLDNLKETQTVSVSQLKSNVKLKEAYNDLLAKTQDQLEYSKVSYEEQKAAMEHKNEAKIGLYTLFNDKTPLPAPTPLVEQDKIMIVKTEEPKFSLMA